MIIRPPSSFLSSSSTSRRAAVASISSWTKIKTPLFRRSDDTSNNNNDVVPMMVELQIQQQFSSPPLMGSNNSKAMLEDTTGYRIWPTALPLLKEIIKSDDEKEELLHSTTTKTTSGNSKKKNEITVLELGSGCGLVGMGLAAYSKRYRVIMTDQPNTIDWLQQNVQKNQHLFFGARDQQIQIVSLTWGKKDNNSIKDYFHERFGVDFDFDWIVGSDLLYNPTAHEPLVSTLEELVENRQSPNCSEEKKTTKILLTYPKRQNDEESFLLEATSRGFQVDITPLEGVLVPAGGRGDDVEYSLAKLIKL